MGPAAAQSFSVQAGQWALTAPAICRGIHRANGPDVRRVTSALLELVPDGGEEHEFDHRNSEGAQAREWLIKQLVGDADDRGRERPRTETA